MGYSADISDNLSPSTFVSEIKEQRLRVFLAVHGEVPFLLVRLNDPTGELVAGLSAAAGAADKPKLDALGFHTVVQSQQSQKGQQKKRISISPKIEFDLGALRRRILATPHFIAPLSKREEDPTYKGRISIGRARNKDIVFRHGSISKFHAWFELDDKGRLSLADAGSKNGTMVKGVTVTPRQLIRVDPGDEIRFGSVDATLCTAEALWKIIHGQTS